MEMKQALDALGALSQETRLEVFRRLVRAGPEGMAAGDIAAAVDARLNTLSTHLKQLAAAGLVQSRREGRSIVYSVDFGTARELILYLLEDCCAGNAAVRDGVADSLAKRCG